MNNIYKSLGLREVINANGKMTALGANTSSEAVSENMKSALKNFVIIEELIEYTGKVIAEKTGAEGGCPVHCAAAGMVIATAAAITAEDLNLIERMPDSCGLKNEIIIQKGHCVNFGGNLLQMIRLGGGKPVEAGCANLVHRENIEGAITEKTAALFYVKSHHAVQKGMQSVETMVDIAHKHNIPLIIDAAAEEDLRRYVEMGADAVVYSGHKAFEGPTSGLICGKAGLMRACRKQYKGVGRAMKVSKEGMIGLITALSEYALKSGNNGQKEGMIFACGELNKIKGLTAEVIQDEAGREIYRARIKVDEAAAGISAAELNEKLIKGSPAIYLRDHYVNTGVLAIDPRPLLKGQLDIVIEKIGEYIEGGK